MAAGGYPKLGFAATDNGVVLSETPRNESRSPRKSSGDMLLGPYTRESVIFETLTGGTDANEVINHTTAHETGHMVDYLYAGTGNVVQSNNATPGGTITDGDEVTITITDSALPAPVDIEYTVDGGDNLILIAAQLAQQINQNEDLHDAGITANSDSEGHLVISSTTGNSTTISRSLSPGATLTLAQGVYPHFSDSAVFRNALEIDRIGMNAEYPCGFHVTDPENPEAEPVQQDGLFAGMKDKEGSYICSGSEGTGDSLNGYSGSNLAIALQAWPTAYRNEEAIELFPEEYAYNAGYPDTRDDNGNDRDGSSHAFNGKPLVCTMRIVQELTTYGRLPTDLHAYGYRQFSGTTKYYTFIRCDGTTTEEEVGVNA